mgnify:CR=1 FL=1
MANLYRERSLAIAVKTEKYIIHKTKNQKDKFRQFFLKMFKNPITPKSVINGQKKNKIIRIFALNVASLIKTTGFKPRFK